MIICFVVFLLNKEKKFCFEKFVDNLIENRVDLFMLKLYFKKGLILVIFIFFVLIVNVLVVF